MRRIMAVICVMASVGLTLANTSCSSDDRDATRSSIQGSPTSDSGELDRLQRMVLSEKDFPEGSQYQVSANASDYGAQIAAALRTTTYEPAACKEPRKEEAQLNTQLQRAGSAALTETGQQYLTAVTSRGAEPISLVKQMFFGECADLTMERSINGNVVTITRQRGSEVQQPAEINADEFLVYLLTNDVQSTLPGDTSPVLHQYRLTGQAWVGELMVTLEQAVSDKAYLDIPQFTALFRTAIDKARMG